MEPSLNDLLERLNRLSEQQEAMRREMTALRRDITRFQQQEASEESAPEPEEPQSGPEERSTRPNYGYQPGQRKREKRTFWVPKPDTSNAESFIGGNLISKVGIVILVIGVGIGAKYAIDNELISPLTRIILGYLLGGGLLGTAFYLKSRYENFSAVLLSGAMAILYFITFIAYDFYELLPQLIAFALMVIFTVFTVLAAVRYDRVVIAHIGLVGAYAVPILLSDGSGQVAVLFTYMSLINVGILVLAFYKYWKSLYYAAFLLTWLVYFAWLFDKYSFEEYFRVAFTFAGVFFLTFYTIFLAYKLLRQELFSVRDILPMLSNAFFFYGAGIFLLQDYPSGEQLYGLFTVSIAGVHLLVSVLVYQRRAADRNLFYFVSGLVLVFLTIAIPVQLDGDWVTLLWSSEALLLFWVGRSRKVETYEKISYVLVALATVSIIEDWSWFNNLSYADKTAFWNVGFLSSLLFTAAFGAMTWLRTRYESPAQNRVWGLFSLLIPLGFLLGLYMTFRNEIYLFWEIRWENSLVETAEGFTVRNPDLLRFSTLWQLSYTLLFLGGLAWVNSRYVKNEPLARLSLLLGGVALLATLGAGISDLYRLQQSYLKPPYPEFYEVSAFAIGIRYLLFVSVAAFWVAFYGYLDTFYDRKRVGRFFDIAFHLSLLAILSSEYITWMQFTNMSEDASYRFGLSIVAGLYALFVVALGIRKKQKHLRIFGIVLFGLTLLKLFVYDIATMSTGIKTLVLVVLGVLLLVVSFLYNRYKDVILEDEEMETN